MAVKKTTKKKEESAVPAKAEAKETATKKPVKKAAPKASSPATTPTPAPTPAADSKAKAAPAKAAAKKAAAPIKLGTSQADLLKKIGETGETGYPVVKKAEQRTIDSLLEKKMIKKGAKDKVSGSIRYHISSAGKKHTS